jgi:stress-induced morphogen
MTKERETHLNMVSEDRSQWIVFTDDPIMIRLFDSKHYEKVKAEGLGFHYKIAVESITFNPIKLSRKPRLISEDVRKARSERMKKLHVEKRSTKEGL